MFRTYDKINITIFDDWKMIFLMIGSDGQSEGLGLHDIANLAFYYSCHHEIFMKKAIYKY